MCGQQSVSYEKQPQGQNQVIPPRSSLLCVCQGETTTPSDYSGCTSQGCIIACIAMHYIA